MFENILRVRGTLAVPHTCRTFLLYLAILGALLQEDVERPHDLVVLRERSREHVQLRWRDVLAVRQPLAYQALRHFRPGVPRLRQQIGRTLPTPRSLGFDCDSLAVTVTGIITQA